MDFPMKCISIKSFLPRSCGFPKHPLFLFFLFAFTLLYNPSIIYSQDADYYFQLGLELKEQGKLDEAIEAFKKATYKNRKFAEAYHQLALCYMRKPNSNLELALDAIIKARRLDWDNHEYIYTLADINFEKNVLFDARFWLNRILKEEPDDLPALKRHVKYLLRDYSIYKYRTSPSDPYYMFNYAYSLIAKIHRLSDRILELDPGDRETLFNKGFLYYDADNIDGFIEYLERILAENNSDKDANLFMGLAYSGKGEHETALYYYNKALTLMNAEERAAFENTEQINALVDVNYWGNFALLPDADTLRFWDKKDPFYLTDINERRLVHYGRFAEANLRFSAPRKGLEGWQTARGLIWIKYGKPLHIKQSYGGFQNFQTWTYSGLEFYFFAGYYSAWLNNFIFWEDEERLEEKIEDLPEFYQYNPPGELFDFPVDVVNFRGKDDKTKVEIFFGVPVNRVGWESDEYGYYGDLQHGIFVHDNDWNRIVENINTVFPEFGKTEIDTASSKLLIASDRFEIEPGSYSLSVEVSTHNSGNAGVTRDSLFVERFGRDSLQMSDILVASLITLIDEQKLPTRDNITIIGEPRHAFLKNEPFYIYYEVYNLFIVDEQQGNRYKVEYGFRPVDLEILTQIESKNLIRNVPLKPLQADQVWVSSEIRGIGKTDFNILKIDHRISDPGVYEFILMITDIHSRMTTTKATPILIY